jgi:Zn-finger nucleic acid-binding protein
MCPACGETLVTFSLEGFEVDSCVACGGTWLDSGEVEAILERSGQDPGKLREALQGTGESAHGKRSCVRCRSTLRGVTFKDAEIDRCPYGHGLWFDKGELRRVVESNSGEVAGFLKEMFKAEFGNQRS